MPKITVYIEQGVTYAVEHRPEVPPPPPPPTGAKFSIAGTAYGSLGAAMTALKDGETLDIAPGSYPFDCGFSRANNITIRCVGGEAVFKQTWGGKSVFTLEGNNITLANLAADGASNSSGNGGLIRFDGENLTATDCRWDRCQTGFLSGYSKPASVVKLIRLKAHENGQNKDGYDHAIYMGGGAELHVIDSEISDTLIGHLVKSRAAKTVITGCTLVEGRASRAVDAPLGGILEIRNTYIRQDQQTDNSGIMNYGDDTVVGADGKRIPKHPVNEIRIGPDVHIFDYRDSASKPPAPRPWYVLKCWLTPTVLDDQSTYNTGTDPNPLPAPPPPPPPPPSTKVTVTRDANGIVTPAFWSSLPARKWVEVDGVNASALEKQLRPEFKEFGNNGFNAVFTAWSGASYRKPRLVGTGAGHLDGSNNCVWELNTDTLQFRLVAQPTVQTLADWQHGWAIVKDSEFPNRFETGYYGDDETIDHQAAPCHSYGALATLPNGDLFRLGIAHAWRITPAGEWVKLAACPAYWFETQMVFYNGMIYQGGHIRYQSCVYRIDPTTGTWQKFPLRDTKGVEKTFWQGHQDQVSFLDDQGRWWWPCYNLYVDLNHPTLACTMFEWGTPNENGAMDAGGCWHNGRKRAYWLGYKGDWGNVYEGDVSTGKLIVRKIGGGWNVSYPGCENFGRFFLDEQLDVLGFVRNVATNLQLFKL